MPRRDLKSRFLSMRVGAMLVRNTIVSCSVFALGLGILWLLVVKAGVNTVLAAGVGFLVANSFHYLFGRVWIFEGTDRAVATGYVLFLVNSGVGLAITTGLYALILAMTRIDFLTARVLVSLVAGLVVFLLNATLNFRQV